MITNLNWNPLRCLNDRKTLYKGPGIYMIGVKDVSLPLNGKDDGYFGSNFPPSFRARYVGMTMSIKFGVASRINSHAQGRGNSNVKNHITQFGIDSLYYTYCETDLADIAETIFIGLADLFDWNDKSELKGAWHRFALEGGPPAPFLSDHLEVWEQLEEIEQNRKVVANWDSEIARHPKHKRINENLKKFRGTGKSS